MKKIKSDRNLFFIGLLLTAFLMLKNENANAAAPKGTCKKHKTNICYIGPLGFEVYGIWYIEIK